jgi:hypothetical protein
MKSEIFLSKLRYSYQKILRIKPGQHNFLLFSKPCPGFRWMDDGGSCVGGMKIKSPNPQMTRTRLTSL